jgi:hypothetical protein
VKLKQAYIQEHPAPLQNSPPQIIDELPRIQASLRGEKSAIDTLTLRSKLIKRLWGFKKKFPNKSEFGDRLG